MQVKVDQVWEDFDIRWRGKGPRRRFKIILIEGDVATCENEVTARHTKVKLSRFKPSATGYRLVSG